MSSLHTTLCVTGLLLMLSSGVLGQIVVVAPVNTAGWVGEEGRLNCTINRINGDHIAWSFLTGTEDTTLYSTFKPDEIEPGYEVDFDGQNRVDLILDPITATKGGRYRCSLLLDTDTRVRAEFVSLDPMKCDSGQGESAVEEGTMVKFICDVTYHSEIIQPALQWYNDQGFTLPSFPETDEENPNRIIMTTNITANSHHDMQRFECRLTFDGEGAPTFTSNCDSHVLVNYGARQVELHPEPENDNDVLQLSVGSEINCSARGRPKPDISWHGEGSETEIIEGNILVMKERFADGEERSYRCEATNVINGQTRSANRTVRFCVNCSAEVAPANTAGWVGEEGRLNCTFNRKNFDHIAWSFHTGTEDATLYSTFKPDEIEPGYDVDFDGQNRVDLILDPITAAKGGRYRCSLLLEDTRVRAEFVSLDPMKCCPDQCHTTVEEGTVVEFSCDMTYHSANIKPDLQWYNDQGFALPSFPILDEENPNHITMTTNITASSDHDMRKFECRLMFDGEGAPAFTSSCDSHVLVNFGASQVQLHPKPENDNDVILLSVGSEINCYAKGRPQPDISWHGEGSETEIIEGNILVITEGFADDEDRTYRCEATNVISGQTRTANRTVRFRVTDGHEGPVTAGTRVLGQIEVAPVNTAGWVGEEGRLNCTINRNNGDHIAWSFYTGGEDTIIYSTFKPDEIEPGYDVDFDGQNRVDLILDPITAAKGGRYRCSLLLEDTRVWAKFVSIDFMKCLPDPGHAIVDEGTIVAFSCDVTYHSLNTKPDLQWYNSQGFTLPSFPILDEENPNHITCVI